MRFYQLGVFKEAQCSGDTPNRPVVQFYRPGEIGDQTFNFTARFTHCLEQQQWQLREEMRLSRGRVEHWDRV